LVCLSYSLSRFIYALHYYMLLLKLNGDFIEVWKVQFTPNMPLLRCYFSLSTCLSFSLLRTKNKDPTFIVDPFTSYADSFNDLLFFPILLILFVIWFFLFSPSILYLLGIEFHNLFWFYLYWVIVVLKNYLNFLLVLNSTGKKINFIVCKRFRVGGPN